MASALYDRWFGGILTVMWGASCFRGGMLWGGFRGTVASLAWVGAPVVVPLALILQGEPTWDIVQLCRVGQVYEDLRKKRSSSVKCISTSLSENWYSQRGLPLLRNHSRSPCRSPTRSLPGSSSSTEYTVRELMYFYGRLHVKIAEGAAIR